MKTIIVAALISVAAALPQFPFPRQFQQKFQSQYQQPQYQQQQYQPQYQAGSESAAQIRSFESDVNEAGFHYAYETDNSIKAEESGQESNGIQAQGSYSYQAPDGQLYQVSYTSGDNGFQPSGAHFPTPPPIPAEIAQALEQNARDEAAGIFDDGSYHEGKYANGPAPQRG